jgi:ribosomal protein S18 acetylase RimI-like enzyme
MPPLAGFPPARTSALATASDSRWRCRALGEHDLAWLPALYASTREQELQAVPWPADAKQQFLEQQFIAQHQHYLAQFPRAQYLAVECDGVAAGRFYLDETGADDRLIDISLFPAWRGQGIGAALIQCQQQSSAARGRALALHVMVHNIAAQRLYARLGFVGNGGSEDGLYLPLRWPPS